MGMFQNLQTDFRSALVPMLCLLGVIYFAFHTLHGPRGFFSYVTLKTEYAEAADRLEDLKTRRQSFEKKVYLMNPKNADSDMVDEQIRKSLGFVKKNEVVIYK